MQRAWIYFGLEMSSCLINNKKYILWNAGICPIAVIVRNTTVDDDIKTHDSYLENL